MEVYFDKNTVKILRKIYKSSDGLNVEEIDDLFSERPSIFLIDKLVNDGYLVGKDDDNKWFAEVKYPTHSTSTFRYYSTPKTNKYFEDKNNQLKLFWFPYAITTFIALSNLIISLINFFK